MTTELKPCPFCGGKAYSSKDSWGKTAACSNDECSISHVSIGLEDWNNRPAENKIKADTVRDAVESCEYTEDFLYTSIASLFDYANKLEKGEV